MNNFGLGLVLSFTDNATSGIQRATGAFNDLEGALDGVVNASSKNQALLQMSYSAGIVGNELYGVGKKITSSFLEAINTINNTGTVIASARSQLGTLYGSMEAGYEVLEKIKDYSAKSIFNFEDLIPSVIMLKANGIEAFDEIATSAYRATNGVEGVSQTLMDYAADLAAFNPNMHNMYGTGVQAAMGALNEYIAEGNAASLKRGASLDILQLLGEEKGESIEERSRQVADLIEQLGMVGMTANLAGTPMQRLANVEDIFFNTMTLISDSGVYDKFSAIVEKFTDFLFSIPDEELENIAQVIAEAIVDIMTPLEKLVDLLISLAEKVRELIKENPDLIKNILKWTAVAGTFALVAGIALKLLSTLGMLKFSIGKLFGNSILESGFKLLGLFKSLLLYFGPLIAATFLLKTAWDNNFLDMQNTVKNFISETFDTLKLLFDALVDNTLSAEGFQRAKELGILPFIEAVLQLKYHLKFLFEGMKEGFNAFADTLSDILIKTGLLDKDTHGLRDTITQLLEKITQPGMTETWKEVGHWIGYIGGWVLIFLAALPTIMKIVSAIVSVVSLIMKVVSVGKAIWNFITLIASSGAVASIISFFSDLIFYLQYAWFILTTEIIPAITGVISAIGLGTTALIALAVLLQVAWTAFVIATFIYVVTHWEKVKGIISDGITFLKNFILNAWNNLKQQFPVIETVLNAIAKIKDIIFSAAGFMLGIAIRVFNAIKSVVGSVASVIGKYFYVVYEVWRVIILAIAVAIMWLKDNIFSPVVDFIMFYIGKAAGWLYTNIFKPIKDTFVEYYTFFILGIKALRDDYIIPIFNDIVDAITGRIQKIYTVIAPLIEYLVERFETFAELLSLGWDVYGDVFSNVGGFFEGVGDNLEGMLGLSTGGYVKTTGAAVLHPDEVVINDVLTQRLGDFLDDYDNSRSPVQTYINNGGGTSTISNSDTDNSVVFESGSIVFNIDKDTDLAKMNESELEALAEKLVKIMARKAQIRQMQTRR